MMLCFVSLSCLFQVPSSRLTAEPISPALSLSEQAFSADQMLAFAAELMREREYYRAITEYRRFLFTFPRDSRRSMAHFRVGLAFYRGIDYGKALEVFGEVAKLYPDTPYGKQAWLWQGECLMRQGKYETAEDFYDAVRQHSPGTALGEHATYRHAWALLRQQEWQKAAEQFRSIPIHNSFRETAQQIVEVILDKGDLSRKSPLLAGVLSATLPGSGQLYVGRQGDALLAFVLNGLFVVGIVEALNHNQVATAGVLSLLEAGWYASNIYGAINGAHKYNRYRAETFMRGLEGQFRYHPPEFPPTARTFGIGLGLRF
jgi:tetratricopeptide (TPR) repeat protein